jgi:hypothetical protein
LREKSYWKENQIKEKTLTARKVRLMRKPDWEESQTGTENQTGEINQTGYISQTEDISHTRKNVRMGESRRGKNTGKK